jgi:hypothetical protein
MKTKVDPSNSNNRTILALITGTQKVRASDLSARSSALIIFRMIKLIKNELSYFPYFEELQKQIYAYKARGHHANRWLQYDMHEGHEERIQKLMSEGFPDGISEASRVICLLKICPHQNDRKLDDVNNTLILTRKGGLYLLGWSDFPDGGHRVLCTVWMKKVTIWDLIRLIKEGEKCRARVAYELRASLYCLVNHHVQKKKKGYENALGVHEALTNIISNFDEHF